MPKALLFVEPGVLGARESIVQGPGCAFDWGLLL